MSTVEQIIIDGDLYAFLINSNYNEPGIQFFTDEKLSQQLASMSYPAGKNIPAHTHNEFPRNITSTSECLFVRRGKLRVDFYDKGLQYRTSRILSSGDVILLVAGGHGFEVIEDLNMIEVKQGPYVGEADKIRFSAKPPKQLAYE